MAQTRRITHNGSSPSTEYGEGADLVAQSQSGNYSVIRVSATCINRGNTSSYYGSSVVHTAAIDGNGQTQVSVGSMPSGVPSGGIRWDQSADIAVYHDGAGNQGGVTLRQTVTGIHSNVQVAALSGFPRIPKPATRTGTPSFSEVLPTSVRVSWSASTDNGGSAIDFYLLRYWPNAAGTGPYTDVSQQNNLSRVVTGLTPGKEYRFVVYAHNNSHDQYSQMSGAAVVRTLSGMWARVAGVWRRTVPYVKVAGIWKPVSVFIKASGVWKRGG